MNVKEHPYYEVLKKNEGKVFRLTFSDGDVVLAKVDWVDRDEYEDFLIDVVEVVRAKDPNRYRIGDAWYAMQFNELTSAELEN